MSINGRTRTAVMAALTGLTLVACSSAAPHRHPAGAARSAATGPGAAAGTVSRWWSDAAGPVGSTIDVTNPTAGAARLHPSRSDYCGMLRQTLAAGHSILPGAGADDPALKAATTAFVSELQHVAPHEVASSWQSLGTAIIILVRSGGSASSLKGIDATKIRSAVTSVSADAKSRCGVDLSATAG